MFWQALFNYPGLPHGCKPPPPPNPALAMQHPCSAPQKPRSMATVSPLHQVVPAPHAQNHLSPYDPTSPAGLNAYGAAPAPNRTSSFAAALRKLAKQAGDPIVAGEKDLPQISPVSSPVLAQRSITPKRNGSVGNNQPPAPSPLYISNSNSVSSDQLHAASSYPSSSPPVVTIAPSRSHPTHTSTDSRKLQVMDMSGLPQGTTNAISNGHLTDTLSLKLDANKLNSRTSTDDKWDDHNTKSQSSSVTSQSRPHATIAPLPRPDDSLTSSRGFQPYRSADDIRNSMPHHVSPFEHHPPASYPYTPAFLPPPHMPHPAYRIDDPLFLDRFGLLRTQVMPFPTQPGVMAAPTAYYPQSRYDLLVQSLSLSSANNTILHHERLKLEEERRQREKEAELDHSRKRELERREKEMKEKEHKEKEQHKEKERKERSHRDKGDRSSEAHNDHNRTNNHSSHSHQTHSKRADIPTIQRNDAISSTPVNNYLSPPVTSSAPLNLVMHPEHQKRESELWLPWQQNQPSQQNSHGTKDNPSDDGIAVIYKHPALITPEASRLNLPKESSSNEKYHSSYPLPYYPETKVQNTEMNSMEIDPKKHALHAPTKKYDSIHHHIAELSKKENNIHNEWKHEKLQKACTNNHRKTISEVKKLREELHHGQQRKQQHANGQVKPIQGIDEGMHARLLETEKSRLEMSNQIRNKNLSPPQIDKMLVPPLVPATIQVNSSTQDANLQKMYIDSHIMSALKPSVIETAPPLKSKLDKELEDMKKKKGPQETEDNEFSLHDFLVLTKGPPLPLDTNQQKMQYLKLLGLTTHLKRKKIELDIYLKRRKLLQEDQTPPPADVQSENDTELKSLCDSNSNMEYLSEKLRSELKTDKVEFFVTLSLSPLSLMQKEEKTKLRKLVEENRKKRDQRLKAQAEKKAALSLLVKIRKEKGNNEDSKEVTVQNSDEVKLPSSSQNTLNSSENVPYPASEVEEQGLNNPALHNNGALSQNTNYARQLKCRTKYSFKRGHSLKCEWNSASPSLEANNHFINKTPTIKTEIKTDPVLVSMGTQADLALPEVQQEKSDKNKGSFNWPGLDAIMEAYYRHHKEQLIEKDDLQKRCNQLRLHQEELKKEANNQSKSMAALLKLQKELEDKRNQYEQAVEQLKQNIQAWR